MTEPNTGPQPTGMMTLESGLNALKAKMAASGTKATDQVTTTLDEDGLEVPVEETDQLETEPASEETEPVSEGESEAETEEILPETAKIILPDGSTITAEEARKGYLRQADFTRKTQAVSQKERELITREQAMTQDLGGLYKQLASLQEQSPTPEQMFQLSREKSPEEFQQIQAYWQNRNAVMAASQRKIQESNKRALNAEKAQAFEALNSGTFDPTWKDAGNLKKALDTVASYWIERGLPPDILEGITNPTVIEVVEESRRYRELQKSKPKAALAVKGKPAPFKPGSKSTATPQSENLRLLGEAFRKNPSIDNAAAFERAKAQARRR